MIIKEKKGKKKYIYIYIKFGFNYYINMINYSYKHLLYFNYIYIIKICNLKKLCFNKDVTFIKFYKYIP